MQTLQQRIRAWHSLATPRQKALGITWYADAREFCRQVSEDTEIPYASVCGVVAALSPACYWSLNKRQAEGLCRAFAIDADLEAVVLSTYSSQAAKARAILQKHVTQPETIKRILGTRAFKTRAFFENLLSEDSQEVTADRHITSALAYTSSLTNRPAYMRIVHAFQNVCKDMHMKPYQMQAIVWIAYKETTDSFSPGEKYDEELAESPF